LGAASGNRGRGRQAFCQLLVGMDVRIDCREERSFRYMRIFIRVIRDKMQMSISRLIPLSRLNFDDVSEA